LVLGFSGDTVLPQVVTQDLIYLIDHIATHQERNVWDAVTRMLSNKVELLTHTSIAVVFRNSDGIVQSREIGRHHPPDLPIGIHFIWCGNRSCSPLRGDTIFKNKFIPGVTRSESEKLKQICRRCGYQSAWVKIKDIEWSHQFPGQQLVYWHDFPITHQQLMTFGDGRVVEKEQNSATGPVGKLVSKEAVKQGRDSEVASSQKKSNGRLASAPNKKRKPLEEHSAGKPPKKMKRNKDVLVGGVSTAA
jgi:hypothetical protein